MRTTGFALALIGACLMLAPSMAQAQATRTWVSGVGDDVNPCSRTAPCKTFPGAISKTAAGGEIDTLDPGGFGAVTVTKAMTIASEGTGEAGILVAGTNGVTVNCVSDPNCTVILRGLQIDGGPIGSNSLSGVKFIAGKSLIIQNCQIRNFTGGSPNGYGVWFNPASGTTSLTIANSTITGNGVLGTSGGGVFIQPTGSTTVNASVQNSIVDNNNAGIRAEGNALTGGSINVSVSNTEASNNSNGGIASATTVGGTFPVIVVIDNSVVSSNNVGINATGATATLRIGTSKLTFNATGYKQQNGATMTSFGNNEISDNPANVGTLGSLPPS